VKLKRLSVFMEMIKFEHTVFALPFAYLGMFLAQGGLPSLAVIFWVTVAMAAARTLAMTLNRLVDREFDARNPRTADRALPKGLLDTRAVVVGIVVSLAVFELAAWQLNRFVFFLSPLALIFLCGYHYAKRFTWACHWILGFTDGIAAAGGWAAVRGSLDPPAVLLWFAVTVWIAGFDLIYACQDVEVDRREGLYSVPSRFGVRTALLLAKINHALTILAFAAVGVMMGLSWPYWAAVIVSAVLLTYENLLVKEDDLSRLDFAFFNLNGYIALALLAGTVGALFISGPEIM
jgi:4-hydroxybenzoate polyprenyltransferase